MAQVDSAEVLALQTPQNSVSNESTSVPSDAAASVPSFAKPIYDHVTNVAKPISVVHRGARDEKVAIFTMIFDKPGDDSILNAITGFDRRSKLHYKKKLKGVKEISELGKLQNGSIPGWHKLKTTLPPCAHLIVYCCVHKPLKAADNNDDDDDDDDDGDGDGSGGEDTKGKHTHVVADCTCKFRVTVRDLVVISGKKKKKNEMLAVTIRQGQHEHGES